MRKTVLLAVTLVACSTSRDTAANRASDRPAADAAARGAGGAAGPTRLTAAQVDGTWEGVSTQDTGTAPPYRWVGHFSGDTAITIGHAAHDTTRYRITYNADSAVVISDPYPLSPGGPMMVWRIIGRLRGDTLGGTLT